MSHEADAVVVPRPAATVLIVRDDPFEVLMVLRSSGNDFYPDAYVFPGGRVEEHDRDPVWRTAVEHASDLDDEERAYRIAAVRETHEEASLLLADGLIGAPPRPVPDAIAFQRLVAGMGARLLLDDVVPYAHWITPAPSPKRFDTRFYLTRAPEGQLAQADAAETNHAMWINPAEAVELTREGSLPVPSPTYLNLMLLAQSTDSEQALAAARKRPRVAVESMGTPLGNGWTRLGVPIEAGYGGTEFDVREPSVSVTGPPVYKRPSQGIQSGS